MKDVETLPPEPGLPMSPSASQPPSDSSPLMALLASQDPERVRCGVAALMELDTRAKLEARMAAYLQSKPNLPPGGSMTPSTAALSEEERQQLLKQRQEKARAAAERIAANLNQKTARQD